MTSVLCVAASPPREFISQVDLTFKIYIVAYLYICNLIFFTKKTKSTRTSSMWQKQVTSTLASTSESTIHNNNKSLVSSPPDRAPSPSRYIRPNLIPIPILLRGLLPKSNCTSRTWRAAADRTLPPHVVQARVCLT